MLGLNSCLFRQGEFTLAADFTTQTAARIAVIGPSGGGKSTLLNGIAGFLPPVEGTITWDTSPLPQHPGQRPLTMLFQSHNLFPHLNVFKNVALGIRPSLRLSPQETDRVYQALAQVGLSEKSQSKPGDLSGGQQGRVGLARVLLRDRPLVLLDEPFAALGPALKDEMLDVLASILDRSQATALMVTHDPADALAFASQVILVADGLAQSPVPAKDLFDNPPRALRDYLGNRT